MNQENVIIKKGKYKRPLPNSTVKLLLTGNVARITCSGKRGSLSNYRRISGGRYMDVATGEVKQYEGSHREWLRNLNRKFAKAQDIINANFRGTVKELHVVLTYSGEMTIQKEATKDLKKFIKKLRYRYPGIEYFALYEVQERGVWHIHLLLKDKKRLYIPWTEVKDLWDKGFVKVKRVPKRDNIGAYFTAYRKTLPTYDENGCRTDNLLENKKAKRVGCYLKNEILYSRSRGIVDPVPIEMNFEDACKELASKGYKESYASTKEVYVSEDDCSHENLVNTMYYLQYIRNSI